MAVDAADTSGDGDWVAEMGTMLRLASPWLTTRSDCAPAAAREKKSRDQKTQNRQLSHGKHYSRLPAEPGGQPLTEMPEKDITRGAADRLVQGARGREDAEKQQVVDGLARVRIDLAGEHLVVVNAAVSVDKDLQHDGVVMVADIVGELERRVEQMRPGRNLQGHIARFDRLRQCEGADEHGGGANSGVVRWRPRLPRAGGTAGRCSPSECGSGRAARGRSCCSPARWQRGGGRRWAPGTRVGPRVATRAWLFFQAANSPAQSGQVSRCLVISSIRVPGTSPSR